MVTEGSLSELVSISNVSATPSPIAAAWSLEEELLSDLGLVSESELYVDIGFRTICGVKGASTGVAWLLSVISLLLRLLSLASSELLSNHADTFVVPGFDVDTFRVD